MDQPVTLRAHPAAQPDTAAPADTGLATQDPVSQDPVSQDPETGAAGAEAHVAEAGVAEAGVDMRRLLEETIDAIRPALQADGGDMTLVGVDADTGVVDIELIGACVGCPASTMTLKAGIERILKDRIPAVTAVNAVGLDPALG